MMTTETIIAALQLARGANLTNLERDLLIYSLTQFEAEAEERGYEQAQSEVAEWHTPPGR